MSETNESPTLQETDKKPIILFRAFTVDPRELTVELLSQPLVPGTVSVDDPNKVLDGNELGVYMSTNQTMVEAAYAHTSKGLSVQSPVFNDRGNNGMRGITLPQCGVVVEVSTDNLAIRKPEITNALKGVYNNGFQGDEYIADKVPSENYRVVRLILSRYANDSEKLIVDVDSPDTEHMQQAIDQIKREFQVREKRAKEFSTFLETLTLQQRSNDFVIKRAWEKHLSNR